MFHVLDKIEINFLNYMNILFKKNILRVFVSHSVKRILGDKNTVRAFYFYFCESK